MKKYMLIPIILLLLTIPITSCSTVSDLMPKALAAETQDTVKQVEINTNDVFAEIQSNIDLVNNLKAEVEQAKINGQPMSLDDVISDIQKVSDSYNKLSSQHGNINKNLLQKISDVENLQGMVDNEIATLRQRRADYVSQLQAVKDPNPDIARTRQESLTQAIKYVDGQIQLWSDFNGVEADIIAQMDTVQKTIDSFLSVIDSSAILFKEGLNLLTLQRDINNALSLFTQDLPKMEQLTQDMKKSWDNLDYLLNALTNISTNGISISPH